MPPERTIILNRSAGENRREYLKHVSHRYSSVTLPIDSFAGVSLPAIFQSLALRRDPLSAEDREPKQRRPLLGEPSEEEPHPFEDATTLGELSEEELHPVEDATTDQSTSPAQEQPAPPKIAQHAEEALRESPQGRLVILGGPGSGKTTTLCALVSHRAQEALEQTAGETPTFLPIFLSVADLARSGKTLQSYLQEVVVTFGIHSSYAEVLWAEIERGDAFVALDSLDEVVPALRPQMIDLINTLAARPGNIWVVGSRFTDYKGGQLQHGQFMEWELLSLTAQARRELAASLLSEVHHLPRTQNTAPVLASDFVTLLEQHPQAAAWGENPLLLSLAALVYAKTGGLPPSRAFLYGEVIEAVLTLREHEAAARTDLLHALTGLSLWLYQEKKGRTFTTDDLLLFLKEGRNYAEEEAETFARTITATGILDLVAHKTYEYRHQTFQEYLAAAELAQQMRGSAAQKAKAYDLAWSKRTYSRWTDVLRLMVGILAQLPEGEGYTEATHWLAELIRQRTTKEGDPGDLGLTLALLSLVEVAAGARWEAERPQETSLLATGLDPLLGD